METCTVVANPTTVEEKEPANVNESSAIMNDAERVESSTFEVEVEEVNRGAWGNKIEFVLATIGFAVGLGNVWRFPYLCQKNGGGAFLIPYFLSLILLGIPLFFLELAIGQRLRKGPVGAWNELCPMLAGVGMTSFMASFYISIYYNMIVGWCFYYLFISFQKTLPYQECAKGDNATLQECNLAGQSAFYWYRVALDTTESIEESGGLQWHLSLVLLLSWIIVFICTMKGVQSAGKVVYFTATFPYLVLIIFFFRAVTLEGASNGLKRMFTPQFDKLADAQVWLDAATQIFYSLGVGFGGLIAMASYNPMNNNCKRDAIVVSLVNCGTSVFASIVVFSILGFKATNNYNECLDRVNNNITNSSQCETLEKYLSDVAQGPGLTFIAFTEAITLMPVPQLWAILFFCMLLTLGIGSMFGNFAGVITPLLDLKVIPIRAEFQTGFVCIISYLLGLLFCQRSGEYWIQMFDNFSVTLGLLFVGASELFIVNYVYGINKFLDDIEFMIGTRPGWYWIIMWKYIGPIVVLILLVASFVDMGRKPVAYTAWDKNAGKTIDSVAYPSWGVVLIILLILSSVIWIPLLAVLRYFGVCLGKNNSSTENVGPSNEGITHSTSEMALTINELKSA